MAQKAVVILLAQNVRAQVRCVECRKLHVIYCNKKLDIRHQMILARALSDFDYTCWAEIFPPEEKSINCCKTGIAMCDAGGGATPRTLEEKTFALIVGQRRSMF